MNVFKIVLQCGQCEGESFKAFDTVHAKEKSVIEIANKIASDGVVNFSRFTSQCTKCGSTEKKKLVYTKDESGQGIIRSLEFTIWMNKVKSIAEARNPRDYKPGDKWMESFWKKEYFDKNISPEDTWIYYTKIIH
jgi:hypothetical protein